MLKYIGKYKVEYEKDIDGNVLIEKNSYIKCKYGEIYRYDVNTLCLYLKSKIRGKIIQNLLKDKIKDIWFGDVECQIWFDENDIDYFANESKAYIKGKDKKPKTYNRKCIGQTSGYDVFENGVLLKSNISQIELYKLKRDMGDTITWIKVR